MTMNRWTVTDPWIFFAVSGAIVAYLLYMMIRRRRGERGGFVEKESEL
jgi:threonine/homoserine/homoserine lactone efflux protein